MHQDDEPIEGQPDEEKPVEDVPPAEDVPGEVPIVDDDGDDPADTPPPHVYGEEIDDLVCKPKFLVKPPPDCELQEVELKRSYRGKVCYFVFPGSGWERVSPSAKIREAQEFFARYCIYLNFEQRRLEAKENRKLEKWYRKWEKKVRKRAFKPAHIQQLRKKLAARNPGLSKKELDAKVEEEIADRLRRITIPDDLHDAFFKTMRNLHKRIAKGKACRKTLVVFIDQYICKNPKPTRTSAVQLRFNQVGIVFPDHASRNILAHELSHLLGKPAPNAGRGVTWTNHRGCRERVLQTSRADWWRPYRFGDYMTPDDYNEIRTNKAGVKLIRKIR